MKFTLSFNCDNAAFDDDLESAVAKLLHWIANRVEERSGLSGVVKDRNGNTIGAWRLESDED